MLENLLNKRDYVVIVAKNDPHKLGSPPGLEKQWQIAQKSLINLAKKCEEFSAQGITLYLATIPFQKFERVNREELEKIFQQGYASNSSNLFEVLKVVIEEYLNDKAKNEQEEKSKIIVIILDSEPEQRRGIIKLIVEVTNKISSREDFGIMFAQVGDDPITRGFLSALDDDLHRAGAKFDIVDTKILGEIEEKDIPQFLLNALFD